VRIRRGRIGSGWAYVLADDADAGDGWRASLHVEEVRCVDAGATCSLGECFRFPTFDVSWDAVRHSTGS